MDEIKKHVKSEDEEEIEEGRDLFNPLGNASDSDGEANPTEKATEKDATAVGNKTKH